MMTRNQYREHIEALGMSQRGAARFFGIGERTGRRLAGKDGDIPRSIELLLRVMVANKLSPEEVLKIAGIKVPKLGFSDSRYDDEGKWITPMSRKKASR